MDAKEIRNYSEDWYTLGKNFLPEFGTPQFARIAGASNSFSYEVVSEITDIKIRLTNKVDTAYVDLVEQVIYISSKYFNSELYASRFGDESNPLENFAIALFNGSVIHEALHIEHTEVRGDGTIPAILRMSRRYDEMVKKFGLDICSTAFNIIEDLYIEAQVADNLATWLQATSDILFPVSSLDSINLELSEISDFLNLAIIYKNKQLRDQSEFDAFPVRVSQILERVSSGLSLAQYRRVELAFDFLDEFEMPEAESGEGRAGADDSEETGDDGEESATKMNGKSELGEGSIPDEIADMLDELEDLSDEELEKIAKELSESSDEITERESETEKFKHYSEIIEWKKLVELDVMKIKTGTYHEVSPITNINFGFLKELQAIRTLNRTPGQARTRGSVMVKSRLTRIATDGKIFAKRDAERKTLKRIEVIINVDFSASTAGPVIDNEFGAAIEMSKVLRSAGIAHSVYGHTSIKSSTPFLFHIFSFDMEVTNNDMDARFERACQVKLSENYDGVVIKRLGEKFTGRNATKYLVNLSDGRPAGPGYHGLASSAHTTEEINNLRTAGINVFAISVVGHVVYANDKIYGDKFNIDGSKNTAAQFRTLIKRMVS